MDESTTKKLAEILANIDDNKKMDEFLTHPKVTDSYTNFKDYYKSLPAVHELTNSDIIEISGIEKSYYYQIMKGTRKPSRDKVLRMCIAVGLSMRETTRALELNESATLYSKNRRDIIITVAINQRLNIIDTNILLDKYGEEPIS